MTDTTIPVHRLTRGPGFHWFGYYDKEQCDPLDRYVLGMEVDFEGRSPRPEDRIRVGMIDTQRADTWTELGTSLAWCWQQGCMLQWVPGRPSTVIWNDRVDGRFVAHLLNIEDGTTRILPHAVYTLDPCGRYALSTDFRRVNDMRPGYGYAGLPDPHADCLAPEATGVWRIDIESGGASLIVSVADVARMPFPHGDLREAKHYFNHLLTSPDGTRFIFLHRWRFGQGGFNTRMLTAAADGSDLRVIDDCGHTSHFCWRDPEHILAFTRPGGKAGAFHLFHEPTSTRTVLLDEQRDGHCMFLRNTDWIVNDTYPGGPTGAQHLYLYHVPTKRRVPLGDFVNPPEYTGEWRCDLHPRVCRSGTAVIIDAAHEGIGRQMVMLDISQIVGKDSGPAL